jgi:hydrogenase maturation protein HypF
MAERAQIVVRGVVQGVGFRPFVYNLAGVLGLKGYVTNTGEGVLIDIEGARVSDFVRRLRNEPPPLSRITDLSVTALPARGYADFSIYRSVDPEGGAPFTLVSPDVSICDDCFRELLDPSDRRYLYPFINCTNCGPRYSITRAVPYDRPNTTMAGFALCPECRREYEDPKNRRFHAQPNACPKCGPRTEFKAHGSRFTAEDGDTPVQSAIKLLKQGGIVAIKGLGGFHIACDATNHEAVYRLRKKKRKNNKPFAVMSSDIRSVEISCFVSDEERGLLQSGRRPILLLRKKDRAPLSEAVSPNNHYVGCMLPYTPLHALLFNHPLESGAGTDKRHFTALVMTSGNLSEEPIVRDNDEAVKKLAGMVDGFLFHNRDIFMRVDDSVIRMRDEYAAGPDAPDAAPTFIRRSRGYAPDPIALHEDGPEVLGCGADLKNTFTLTKGKFAVLSQHIGDMENFETLAFYEECLSNLRAVYRADPRAVGHDLHPGYLSTRWAIEYGTRNAERGMKAFGIQHHYAHIGSVMAEHGLTRKVIGVAFDGTGYGIDGNLWGGEFLVADISGFERAGQFRYVALPGGEAAIKEPWKTAVSFLMTAAENRVGEYLQASGFPERYGKATLEQLMMIARSTELSPLSSGAGRLFDAVSALLGVCDCNTFEGEAAMALEALTREGIDGEYDVESRTENRYTVLDFSPAIIAIVDDLSDDVSKEEIAAKFHNTVASAVRTVVRQTRAWSGLNEVALGGGTFQNRYLLSRVRRLLSRDGFAVFTNKNAPCNDAGISLGQAYLVRERLRAFGTGNAECGI